MRSATGSDMIEPVVLQAAGSLQTALSVIARDFEAATGIPVKSSFGPSGLLCDAILRGEPVDLFASANMAHPARVAETFGGRVILFARNAMCALLRPTLQVDSDTLLDAMLDPAVRLAISTPGADPSGDYALAVFDRAELMHPVTRDALRARSLMLAGSPDAPSAPPSRNRYGYLVETGQADIFLTYRTNAIEAVHEVPQLRAVDLPEDLAVTANYGLITLSRRKDARGLVDHIMAEQGQSVLERFGFLPAHNRAT